MRRFGTRFLLFLGKQQTRALTSLRAVSPHHGKECQIASTSCFRVFTHYHPAQHRYRKSARRIGFSGHSSNATTFGRLSAEFVCSIKIRTEAAAAIYLIPSIVAACRNHHQFLAIAVLNFSIVAITALAVFFLFGISRGESDRVWLGLTAIGWIAALVWACTNDRTPPPVSVHE